MPLDERVVLLHGQDYKKLYAECQRRNAKFVDNFFPASESSLWNSASSERFPVRWVRCEDLTPMPRLVKNLSLRQNITQGAMGDCWLVSALAVLRLYPRLLEQVMPRWRAQDWQQDQANSFHPGIFRFRFYRFGTWIEVVVDSYLPTYAPENSSTEQANVLPELIYARSSDPQEFWPSLIEKAYAKLCGSYEALDSGSASDAFVDLTGTVPDSIDLTESPGRFDVKGERGMENLFRFLASAHRRAALMSCSIGTEPHVLLYDIDTLRNGLIVGHSYSIIDIHKERRSLVQKMAAYGKKQNSRVSVIDRMSIRLHNPWGEGVWNGEANNINMKEAPCNRRKTTGTTSGDFWMPFAEFCTHFTHLVVCRQIPVSRFAIHQSRRWHTSTLHSNWSITNGTAGGCINYEETFLNNHQYMFEIRREVDCIISLTQQDSRRTRHLGRENLVIGFVIFRVESNRQHRLQKAMYDVVGRVTYMNAREISTQLRLKPARYVCVPTTFEPDQEGEFFMRFFFNCNDRIRIRELTSDYPNAPLWHRLMRRMTLLREHYFEGYSRLYLLEAQMIRQKDGQQHNHKAQMSETASDHDNRSLYGVIIFENMDTKRWLQEHRTKTVSASLRHSFNQDCVCFIKRTSQIAIVVKIFQRYYFRKDKFIGEARFPLVTYARGHRANRIWELQLPLQKSLPWNYETSRQRSSISKSRSVQDPRLQCLKRSTLASIGDDEHEKSSRIASDVADSRPSYYDPNPIPRHVESLSSSSTGSPEQGSTAFNSFSSPSTTIGYVKIRIIFVQRESH